MREVELKQVSNKQGLKVNERIDNHGSKLSICSEVNFSRYEELANLDWFDVSYKLIESSNAS